MKSTNKSIVPSKPTKKPEPYTTSPDGHYVGCDGFVVPKNFAEFYEREPMSVRRFLMKKLHRQVVDEALLDMEQDLLLYLHYLPEKSKYRKEGKTDVISCFDPAKQHGANAKRFHNYLALCMSNRFCTLLHKQKKNPVYCKYNLSIVPELSERGRGDSGIPFQQSGEISEDFLHRVSVTAQSHHDDEKTRIQTLFIAQFKDYVHRSAPEILPLVDAISSGSVKEARATLGLNGRTFERYRETLELLRDCFLRGEEFATSKMSAKNRRNDRLKYGGYGQYAKNRRRESASPGTILEVGVNRARSITSR